MLLQIRNKWNLTLDCRLSVDMFSEYMLSFCHLKTLKTNPSIHFTEGSQTPWNVLFPGMVSKFPMAIRALDNKSDLNTQRKDKTNTNFIGHLGSNFFLDAIYWPTVRTTVLTRARAALGLCCVKQLWLLYEHRHQAGEGSGRVQAFRAAHCKGCSWQNVKLSAALSGNHGSTRTSGGIVSDGAPDSLHFLRSLLLLLQRTLGNGIMSGFPDGLCEAIAQCHFQ